MSGRASHSARAACLLLLLGLASCASAKVKALEEACAGGEAGACDTLAAMYLLGEGAPKDEAKAVEMIFLDPMNGVVDYESADVARVDTIEIDRLSPFTGGTQERRREFTDEIARGAEVVVNDIENHGEAGFVCSIDERPRFVRSPVEP